jgi:hypothetical protein
LVWLGACGDALAAEQVDTGSQCVTALHEEAENAGPLPSRLISLLNPKGQRLLDGCTACRNYPAIAASFTTQVTQAFCGVASSITVLNASTAPKPLSDPYKPYPYFTQCNISRYVALTRPRVLALDGAGRLWIGGDGKAEAPWQPGPGEIWQVGSQGGPRLVLTGPVPQAIAVSPGGHLRCGTARRSAGRGRRS